ncbi:MAG: hypothetical protein NTY48_03645 [Candidatus Diapherotrites archaeon]|nr:hypothetical protein [Candidatus Diapherotrites archaeon]
MKGFVSYALILAMTLILILFTQNTQNNYLGLEKVKNELIIAEEANKQRTLLENNTDKIVKAKLEEQINNGNYNSVIALSEINTILAKYLNKKTFASTLLHQKIGETTKEYLIENSTVQILRGEGIVYAEYSFTSSILKNTIVSAKLGREIISYFQIPAEYTQKIISLR